jgi:FtsP/CotA-like multicopper oxidase with cupredoxin domain
MRIALAGIVAALAFTATASAAVPDTIAVPAGNTAYLSGHATGVQIYACTATGWTLEAPRAVIRDKNGHVLLTHYAGPTWEARDGSTVVGRRDAGVNVDPTAIDWLRLAAASTAPGADGNRLGRTT